LISNQYNFYFLVEIEVHNVVRMKAGHFAHW